MIEFPIDFSKQFSIIPTSRVILTTININHIFYYLGFD